jgi:uncharacterized membrane protein
VPGTLRRTERGFERLMFFSDAVVAIAITLLILPLVDSVKAKKVVEIGDLLHKNSALFFAFFLSFIVIARLWTIHHSLFERIDKYNSLLMAANMLWLVSIVFLPYPTELLAVRGSDEAAVRFVYIASVLASSALLLALQIVMRRSPELWVDSETFDDPLSEAIVTVLALVVALIVGTAVPAIGMWALFLLLASGPIEALLNRRRSHRNA